MAKVLLIEDDEELSLMIQDWLAGEHYQVEAVNSGKEGQDRLRFYPYDLAIIDWNLPEVTGVEICKLYRGMGGNCPILMLTGRDTVSEKELGLDSGADDYLTKPFHMKELSARLRALLRRPREVSPNVLKVGEFELDPSTYKVTRCGESLELLPMEFALLEFFMRHPNQYFSQEALLDHVWKSDADASPDAFRSCLKRLRKKIDADPDNSVIQNLKGVGYKFQS